MPDVTGGGQIQWGRQIRHDSARESCNRSISARSMCYCRLNRTMNADFLPPEKNCIHLNAVFLRRRKVRVHSSIQMTVSGKHRLVGRRWHPRSIWGYIELTGFSAAHDLGEDTVERGGEMPLNTLNPSFQRLSQLLLIQPTMNAKGSLNRRDNNFSNDTRRC